MAKKSSEQIGVVSLSPLPDGGFNLRWRDPLTGRDRRRRFRLDRKEARAVATTINQTILSGEGLAPDRRVIPSIHESIATALRLSRQRDYVRKESARQAVMFERWLVERYPRINPEVDSFKAVAPSMLREYARCMESEGQSWESRNTRFKPIRAAWKLIEEDHPGVIPRWPTKLLGKKPHREVDCLNAKEVHALLNYLEGLEDRTLYRFVVCLVLAGMRPSEVRSLRRCDVDPEALTVSIVDTENHETKTEGSWRTIPVCHRVMSAIMEEMNLQKVIPSTGEIFTRPETHELWTKDSLSRLYEPLVRRRIAEATGEPRIASFTMYSLRASFMTMASRLGVPDHLIRAYVGHTPPKDDTLGRHYRSITVDEKRMVSDAMNGWEKLLEEEEVWQESGNRAQGDNRKS